jgi:predicted amidohydrolase
MVSPWIDSRALEELCSADFAASVGSSNQSSESERRTAARELYNMLPLAERNNIDADRIAEHVSLCIFEQLSVVADPWERLGAEVRERRQYPTSDICPSYSACGRE